jgi:copper ion binding protein
MMQKTSLRIEGMSCQHCVMRVKKAVDLLPGVSHAEVGVGTAEITYDESKIKQQDLEQAVEKAGYKISK